MMVHVFARLVLATLTRAFVPDMLPSLASSARRAAYLNYLESSYVYLFRWSWSWEPKIPTLFRLSKQRNTRLLGQACHHLYHIVFLDLFATCEFYHPSNEEKNIN